MPYFGVIGWLYKNSLVVDVKSFRLTRFLTIYAMLYVTSDSDFVTSQEIVKFDRKMFLE